MSGLSLVRELIHQGITQQKTVLIIESRKEYVQDKIWSFWNVENTDYSDIEFHSWQYLELKSSFQAVRIENPVPYISIDSKKFYDSILELIEGDDNVQLIQGEKFEVDLNTNETPIPFDIDGDSYEANQIFDSRLPKSIQKRGYDLLQHFKGRHIEVSEPIFDPKTAVLMDFTTEQKWGLSFMYILPMSEKEALFEATWFSKKVLEESQYDNELDAYIRKYLKTHEVDTHYLVHYVEKGVIPMSTSIPQHNKWKSIIPIGTAGGITRPSTGYTFLSTQKYSFELVNSLATMPKIPKIYSRWLLFLDEILLRVLARYPDRGPKVFLTLFQKNPPIRIINFLSGSSTLKDQLIIMIKVPYLHLFTFQAVKSVFAKFRFW